MRSLAVWTTTAAVALLGVANAQTPASPEAASTVDLQTAVTAYAAYQSDVSELRSSTMRDANALEGALDRVSRHNRDALTRGWVAYGANTAAQSPAFVQGVRDAAAYYGRDAVIWAVSVDPSYARGLRGGQEATNMLLASANADSARIISVADRYLKWRTRCKANVGPTLLPHNKLRAFNASAHLAATAPRPTPCRRLSRRAFR